ncbi:uncharacterized protein OsI_027940-like [Durio zibethinus]|uniref:Co-chaperone protein p23 n=1 Tax=Durio zibethinus TaxID=66656 RepID=A0A6P6B1I3_DURZI|nr:uncharacterized protein OsI_027940-like [Durio zibethinus]
MESPRRPFFTHNIKSQRAKEKEGCPAADFSILISVVACCVLSRVLHSATSFLLYTLLTMSRHPEIKWAERADKVYLTVLLPDSKNAKVNLEPEGVFTFSATAGADNNLYEVKLDLHDKVIVEESKINIGVRSIFCILEKAEKVWWKKLLRGGGKIPHYIKVDWDKWVDEDEDNGGPGDIDLGGMDFSKFGDMGGMGSGDMGDFEDSDEEEEEVTKPAEEDTNKAEGDAKPEELGGGTSEKKEAATST